MVKNPALISTYSPFSFFWLKEVNAFFGDILGFHCFLKNKNIELDREPIAKRLTSIGKPSKKRLPLEGTT